jgi:hypothetical protein
VNGPRQHGYRVPEDWMAQNLPTVEDDDQFTGGTALLILGSAAIALLLTGFASVAWWLL